MYVPARVLMPSMSPLVEYSGQVCAVKASRLPHNRSMDSAALNSGASGGFTRSARGTRWPLGLPCGTAAEACVRSLGRSSPTVLHHVAARLGLRGGHLFVCLFVCRIAPLAVQMYQRFSVSNAQQEELLALFEFSGALTRLARSAPGLRPLGLLHSIHGRIDTCAQTAWSCVSSRRLCVDLCRHQHFRGNLHMDEREPGCMAVLAPTGGDEVPRG